MKDGQFESRKEQLEKESLPLLVKALKNDGCAVTRRQRGMIREELESALAIGAIEERSRILKLLSTGKLTEAAIIERSVYDVLGYEK